MPQHITHIHATKANKPGRIYDSCRGLHLWVKSTSAKYWIFRKSHAGKRTDFSLGSFPKIGAAEARRKAAELSLKIDQGVPFQQLTSAFKRALEPTKVIVFEEFAKEIIESKRPEWKNIKHAQQWANTLRDYVYPFIGQKALDQIDTDDILKVLKPIWQIKTETSTRLRGRLEKILSAATTKGLRVGVNPAQWKNHLEHWLPQPKKLKKVRHHPALHYKEISNFIKKLQGREGVATLALEFCILTTSRTGEVIKATRCEIKDNIWTVPAERMKGGREHIVPLCSRVLQLIAKARLSDPDSEFLFSRDCKPLSSMALLALLKRMDCNAITTHGFRSTFRDWVSEETSHSPEVAEMCLAHVIANRVEAAYRRGNLLEKRRVLLSDWESFCMGNVT